MSTESGNREVKGVVRREEGREQVKNEVPLVFEEGRGEPFLFTICEKFRSGCDRHTMWSARELFDTICACLHAVMTAAASCRRPAAGQLQLHAGARLARH